MRMIITILIQLMLSVALISQETKFVDITGTEYKGRELVDSVIKYGLQNGIEYNTMAMLVTNKIKIRNDKYKDKYIIFLLSKSLDSLRNLVIICDDKIDKDTLLKFDCWVDKEWLYLCYDKDELKFGFKDGYFVPELPYGGEFSYFSLYHFEANDTYYFEADILGDKIFNDKPNKKKKREEVAKTITECLIELLEKL